MSRIVQTIVNSDRTRRVDIYEAAGGTFGFTHWKWGTIVASLRGARSTAAFGLCVHT